MNSNPDYMRELSSCELCEHRCRVNRLAGEQGVCCMTLPEIASRALHPAPPQSYTVFTAGCNFKCLNCQNWSISQYPDNRTPVDGYVAPSFKVNFDTIGFMTESSLERILDFTTSITFDIKAFYDDTHSNAVIPCG